MRSGRRIRAVKRTERDSQHNAMRASRGAQVW
jgi:hypothetical protein